MKKINNNRCKSFINHETERDRKYIRENMRYPNIDMTL